MFLCFVGISFIPREVGEHVVSIKKNGSHVANSPVTIMVVQSEIGDARRARVFGRGLVEGRTFEMCDFIVDTRDAGWFHHKGSVRCCESRFPLRCISPSACDQQVTSHKAANANSILSVHSCHCQLLTTDNAVNFSNALLCHD